MVAGGRSDQLAGSIRRRLPERGGLDECRRREQLDGYRPSGCDGEFFFLGMEASITDMSLAQACWEESLALWQELQDPRGIAPALINLGYIALVQGEHDRAGDLLKNGLAAARASGERSWRILAKYTLGGLAVDQGYDAQGKRRHSNSHCPTPIENPITINAKSISKDS